MSNATGPQSTDRKAADDMFSRCFSRTESSDGRQKSYGTFVASGEGVRGLGTGVVNVIASAIDKAGARPLLNPLGKRNAHEGERLASRSESVHLCVQHIFE